MKNFDLNSYGVQEMDAKAMEEANGGLGWFAGLAVAAAACIAWDIVMNPKSAAQTFKKGFDEGFNS